MFEKATRLGLRWSTTLGQLNVEDLWNLPLSGSGVCLDKIAKQLNKEIKEEGEESFVVEKSTKSSELELKFDIVKYIIGVKITERDNNKRQAEVTAQKEKIARLISKKRDESLENQSIEQLEEMLKSL